MLNVEDAWGTWYNEFIRICNKNAPLMDHKIRVRSNPWVSRSIRKLIYERDYWHNHACRTKSIQDFNKYRCLRNKVTSLIRNQKKNYISSQLFANKGKPGNTWKILERILPSTTRGNIPPDMDADGFNEFFCSIGKKVTEHFGPTILHDFFPFSNSIFILPPIDFKFAYEFLVSLPNSVSLDLLKWITMSLNLVLS